MKCAWQSCGETKSKSLLQKMLMPELHTHSNQPRRGRGRLRCRTNRTHTRTMMLTASAALLFAFSLNEIVLLPPAHALTVGVSRPIPISTTTIHKSHADRIHRSWRQHQPPTNFRARSGSRLTSKAGDRSDDDTVKVSFNVVLFVHMRASMSKTTSKWRPI